MSGFKAGDVVRLKSGGPKMTVEVPNTQFGFVACTWFSDRNKHESANFSAEALEVYVEPGVGSALPLSMRRG